MVYKEEYINTKPFALETVDGRLKVCVGWYGIFTKELIDFCHSDEWKNLDCASKIDIVIEMDEVRKVFTIDEFKSLLGFE